MRIALVGCTKRKKSEACPAREMYQESDLFQKVVKYVELHEFDSWYILSAKYGLVHPDLIIQPYDLTLKTFSGDELRMWNIKVINSFIEIIGHRPVYVEFLCGEKYRSGLVILCKKRNISYSEPLKGMGLGQQLSFLKGKLNG